MNTAWDAIMAEGMPVIGLSGPYTQEGKDQHVAAFLCQWIFVSPVWWRLDLSGELTTAQENKLAEILSAA